jgi:hypothetical protein
LLIVNGIQDIRGTAVICILTLKVVQFDKNHTTIDTRHMKKTTEISERTDTHNNRHKTHEEDNRRKKKHNT